MILFSRVILLAIVLLFTASCSRSGDNATDSAGASNSTETGTINTAGNKAISNKLAAVQHLRKGNGAEVQTLDPHKAEGVPASNILRDLYEGLTIEAPNGDVIPGGAESWEISEDGTVYTFKIRQGAKWSNGDPVTAHDFEFGLKRSANPTTGSKYSMILSPILNVEAIIANEKPIEEMAVKALDDYTLEITLKAPTPFFLGLLNHSTTYPVHKGNLETHGNQFSRPGKLVGNGAYTLTEWVVQSHIIIERNDQYWDNANTRIDKVSYLPIEDDSTELKRYRAGEVDYTATVPLSQYKWIRENLNDELHADPYLGTYYYGFNLVKPPFENNLKLRKALSLAVDRTTLTGKVMGTGEIPAYSWVPPGMNNYTSQTFDYADMTQPERLELAQKLYQEAGYSKDNPLEIEIRYNTNEGHKKIAIAISAMWKQALGVKVSLLNEEWKVFLENRKQKIVTQVFRAGWIGDYNDPYTFLELMHSKHGINDSAYNNPEYDQLLSDISLEADPAKRRALMEKAEAIMLADHPIMPIYTYASKKMIKPYVAGYEANILDHHYSKDLKIMEHN